jgi:hypothetical protein
MDQSQSLAIGFVLGEVGKALGAGYVNFTPPQRLAPLG